MKAQTVDIRESMGRILCCTIFRPGGKKLLAKGHVLSEEDIRLLQTEGMEHVWVTELEDGEVGEDDAVMQVSRELGCGCLEIRLAAGGRANLVATEDCAVLVDDELLKQINCTASIVISTMLNFSHAKAGQRICTVKSAPFAIAQAQLEAVINIIRERGPILQARPIRNPTLAVLYSDPVSGDRARQLFENIMRQRLERFGIAPSSPSPAPRTKERWRARFLTCSVPDRLVSWSPRRLPPLAPTIPSVAPWPRSDVIWNVFLHRWSLATFFC